MKVNIINNSVMKILYSWRNILWSRMGGWYFKKRIERKMKEG
jgi:hypothetical protein